jgi:hypothetical protein
MRMLTETGVKSAEVGVEMGEDNQGRLKSGRSTSWLFAPEMYRVLLLLQVNGVFFTCRVAHRP